MLPQTLETFWTALQAPESDDSVVQQEHKMAHPVGPTSPAPMNRHTIIYRTLDDMMMVRCCGVTPGVANTVDRSNAFVRSMQAHTLLLAARHQWVRMPGPTAKAVADVLTNKTSGATGAVENQTESLPDRSATSTVVFVAAELWDGAADTMSTPTMLERQRVVMRRLLLHHFSYGHRVVFVGNNDSSLRQWFLPWQRRQSSSFPRPATMSHRTSAESK